MVVISVFIVSAVSCICSYCPIARVKWYCVWFLYSMHKSKNADKIPAALASINHGHVISYSVVYSKASYKQCNILIISNDRSSCE